MYTIQNFNHKNTGTLRRYKLNDVLSNEYNFIFETPSYKALNL